jgi:hypothetical protein
MLVNDYHFAMKRILLALILIGVSAAGANAICKRVLADHSHSDLDPKPTGIFDVEHGGGLDKNGGHYDRSTGTYHFHR